MLTRTATVLASLFYLIFVKPFLYVYRRIRYYSYSYCTVFYFHSISKKNLSRFKKQITLLSILTHPISIDSLNSLPKRKRHSILTHDDCYRSIIKEVLPELIIRNIPLTIFIPFGHLGKCPGWLEGSGHIDEHEHIAFEDELTKLPKDLVNFGSHTVTHRRLSELSSQEVRIEIHESKRAIERLLNMPIRYIAFPYGDYSEFIIAQCKIAGYERVFTTQYESSFHSNLNFVMGRTEFNPSDWYIELALKLLGAYDWLSIRRLLNKHEQEDAHGH